MFFYQERKNTLELKAKEAKDKQDLIAQGFLFNEYHVYL